MCIRDRGGGSGGSVIFYVFGNVTFAGSVDVSGGNGGNATGGGGGGGGGGYIAICHKGTLSDTGSYSVVAGTGGTGSTAGSNGVAGVKTTFTIS